MKAALIKLHIAVFLWGFTGVLGRLITLNEGLLVWYRMLITVLVLLLILFLRKEKFVLPTPKILQLTGIGAIIAMHWVFFYGSIKYSNVSIALTCLSSAGLFTAFFEPIFFRRKISIEEILLGLTGIAGIYLIFHFDARFQTGIIIGIISTILSVLFSILNKKYVTNLPARTVMFYELSGGWLVLSLIIPFYLNWFPPSHILPTASDFGWLLLLSTFCTVLAMDLSLQALKKISVFTQNLTLNLEPVYGIILAFAVYKENAYLGSSFYIGFGLIVLAVIMQMLRMLHKIKKFKKAEHSDYK